MEKLKMKFDQVCAYPKQDLPKLPAQEEHIINFNQMDKDI